VRFAEEGAAVVVADILEDPGKETVGTIEKAGGRATFVAVDVTSPADNAAMARTAIEQYDGLHVVVTAGGGGGRTYVSGDFDVAEKSVRGRHDPDPVRAFMEMDFAADDWQGVIDVNLTGTMRSLQACVAAMVDHGCADGASLITIASIGARHPDAGTLGYGAAKAGVWFITKKLARDLVGAGIRVNAIGPGFIETNLSALVKFMPEAAQQNLYRQIPMGRFGKPIDIANTALFLASDEAGYFTGEILHPDGGFYTD
jgi:NAD(P)-dependent dehydrogenase (short-subunit alcohol dehydrogenase family)